MQVTDFHPLYVLFRPQGENYLQLRTFARSTLAYGSMVLSVYCVSFFAQPGEKMTHEALNIIGKRKSYM